MGLTRAPPSGTGTGSTTRPSDYRATEKVFRPGHFAGTETPTGLSGEIPARRGELPDQPEGAGYYWTPRKEWKPERFRFPDSLGQSGTNLDDTWICHGNGLVGADTRYTGQPEKSGRTPGPFDKNNLTGEIPSSLGELPLLEALYISDNRLTGCIPVGLAQTCAG